VLFQLVSQSLTQSINDKYQLFIISYVYMYMYFVANVHLDMNVLLLDQILIMVTLILITLLGHFCALFV